MTILTPDQPDGEVHRIDTRSIQTAVDGRLGTNGEIQDYYDVLDRFAD